MTSTEPNNRASIDRPDWLTETAWPFKVRTAHVAGSTIAYTDEGDGPPLLLVHDGLCSYLWVHLIDQLRDRFRVLSLDFPGSGLSLANDRPVSIQADSRLLEGLISQLELSELTLAVHDLGGSVGLGFAVRHPDQIDGLVLINTFAWPPHTTALRGMLQLMGSRPLRALNAGTSFMARASSSRFGVGRHFNREQKRAFVDMFERKESRRRFHDLMRSAVRETTYLAAVEDGLTALADKPALTIFGKRNDPFRFQVRWSQLFPKASQMVIPGGYHFPMCDDPEGVSERIATWHAHSRGR